MKYTTKYNLNQLVWALRDNKVQQLQIQRIIIRDEDYLLGRDTTTRYGFYKNSKGPLVIPANDWFELKEDQFFATKAELLASL